jgi:hypothetical protein
LDEAGVNLTSDFVAHLAKKFGNRIKIHNQTASMDNFNQAWNFSIDDWHKCITLRNCDSQLYINLTEALLSEVDLPDMEFVVRAGDNTVGPLGALYSEGIVGEDLLLPGREFADGQRNGTTKSIRKGHQNCSVVHKGAVFRGQPSGTDFGDQNDSLPLVDSLGLPSPRYEAVLLSKRRPDLLDAGFYRGVPDENILPNLAQQMRTGGLIKDSLNDEDQRCYEAIVVIDGASVADRLPNQLAYGIPLILVRNRQGRLGRRVNDEFYYPEMVDGVHYFSATPESLETVLEDVLALPAATRAEVGERGQQFVQDKLSDDRIRCYTYNLLTEYAARFHEQRDGHQGRVKWKPTK